MNTPIAVANSGLANLLEPLFEGCQGDETCNGRSRCRAGTRDSVGGSIHYSRRASHQQVCASGQAYKIAKVNKLPSSLYSKAKRALHDVWVAETRSSAETTSNGPAMKIASRGFEQAAVVLAHQRYVVALCRGAMLWRYVVDSLNELNVNKSRLLTQRGVNWLNRSSP
jgi:hypothetical protein